jgi:predicted N-acetyltransferase YhbS
MVELHEMSRQELAASFDAEVQALLRDAFPSDEATAVGDYYPPYGPPATILVLREGHPKEQRVIGHLVAYRREIAIGPEAVEIGMIGGVAVAPSHRRRGHARALVERTHVRFRQWGLPFSVLFAYEPRVYASMGYRPMENMTRFLDSDGTWKTLVHRGGMYAELAERRWPNLPIDLRGRAV